MTITMATFLRKVEAVRWDGPDAPLPDGWHPCRPEVHWGAGRRLIYFTYAGLMLRHWLGVERLPERPDSREGFAGHVGYAPADGLPPYFREWLDFTVWSVKAESQLTGDHRPVFFDPDGDEGAGMLSLWHDFCSAEQWPNPLPRYAEYRIADAKYGRGYKPVYIGVGCWLISEDGHEPRAVSDKEFERMRVAAS